jgi:two-component system response regulator VicR
MTKSLTTGEIAKYCQVNLRTVIRWIAAGKLKGYKLPGRGNNRVQIDDFIDFLKLHRMPIPSDLLPKTTAPSILIVDDELIFGTAIRRILRKDNYDCAIATDGFQAGVMLKTLKPDLMTLDLTMPGIDGFDVLAYVRSQEEFKDLKILVISALPESKLSEAILVGASDVLSKPFENDELLAKVSALLKDNK